MNIGEAVEALWAHKKVQRSGWNGKNMYIYLESSGTRFEPYIVMKTADNKLQPGWLASQADLLAFDWELYE